MSLEESPIVARVRELRAAGLVPDSGITDSEAPAAIPPPDYGKVMVKVRRVRLFRDSLSDTNETAQTFELADNFEYRSRARTKDEALAGIEEVEDPDTVIYVDNATGKPCAAPAPVAEPIVYQGDDMFQSGSSALNKRGATKLDWSKTQGPSKPETNPLLPFRSVVRRSGRNADDGQGWL
jgi:hypothetical protein